MELTNIEGNIVFIIIIALIITIIQAILKHPKIRGIIGELKIRRLIGKTVEGKKYIINNLHIKHGTTCQIDHIVIIPYGVLIIETKNISGNIRGSKSSEKWTQTLKYGKVKNKFYNPVKQNERHVRAIKSIIGYEINVESIVVFVQGNIANITAPNVYTKLQLRGQINYLKKIKYLSGSQMKEIYEKILQKAREDNISAKEHVRNIREAKQAIDNNICPRCGKPLRLINGQYGDFWGCTGYPQCKFKKGSS